MSAYQRRKGASYEREVAGVLSDYLGTVVKRELAQARDGGHDLSQIGKFKIECKIRDSIAVYKWLEQVDGVCAGIDVPLVIARGRGKESIVIMKLKDFMPLMSGELGEEPA